MYHYLLNYRLLIHRYYNVERDSCIVAGYQSQWSLNDCYNHPIHQPLVTTPIDTIYGMFVIFTLVEQTKSVYSYLS